MLATSDWRANRNSTSRGAKVTADASPTTATEHVVSGEQISATPALRIVEIFEAAPGLIAAHSAEGEAPLTDAV